MSDLQGTTDPLERVMLGMKGYIDGEVQELRTEMTNVLAAHVAAIHELRELVDGVRTEMTLSVAFDGDAYRRFIVEECARMDVKPSELAKAKRDAEPAEDGSGPFS